VPKNRESERAPHRVFLTKTALDLIGDLQVTDKKTGVTKSKEFIFPCPHKTKNKSINRHALSRAILNNCPLDCTYDCDKCENSECRDDKRPLQEKNRLGIAHFTPHDLRRTAATFMAEAKEMDEVIDAVLNHVKQGVIKIYNQYRYDKEKQKALETWERKLNSVITGKKATVVTMREVRG
jgi:integrase